MAELGLVGCLGVARGGLLGLGDALLLQVVGDDLQQRLELLRLDLGEGREVAAVGGREQLGRPPLARYCLPGRHHWVHRLRRRR